MKKHIAILILTFSSTISFAQNSELERLEKWILKTNTIFNSPKCPDGFEHFQNCNEIQAYRKIIGDTLILYSRGGSIAEDIETLNESIKDERFNIYRYPLSTQENGTIIIQEMRKWIFLSRNDTLYLFDEYDERKSEEYLKIMDTFFKGKISESEYQRKAKENEQKNYGFIPKFKAIYFKGIFAESTEYTFNKKQNFREEKVQLWKTWKNNDKNYYKINLTTWTAGEFVISEDLEFINTEICKE